MGLKQLFLRGLHILLSAYILLHLDQASLRGLHILLSAYILFHLRNHVHLMRCMEAYPLGLHIVHSA